MLLFKLLMSNSGSTGSFTDSTGYTGGVCSMGDTLQIPNYHFKGVPIPSLAHGENVDIVFGYRQVFYLYRNKQKKQDCINDK